ncbi:hypothetical protein HU200_036044 [Digitaria exilis]|uniref:Alpha/beta hydrolase fold-3 domain-containing protein n=1 Tax=Digitaria exilis TaxID=1010633 RepID=A0A835BGX1_9POAL|nr:hypothetical protein HU200_036044 [Digitaria exilis]
MAAAADTAPRVVEDCRGVLQVLSDGTVLRHPPPAMDVPIDPSVEWKDVVYDAALGLGLRMYKPSAASSGGGGKNKKLPVVVIFHGGGFCINSYAAPHFHAACTRLAAGVDALVLSADYRLAPEHRLPAAIDDAAAALLWLRGQFSSSSGDPWLSELADPSRVFVAGESAGGVLTHHLNVRFSGGELLHPLRIRGFVPMMPFFTGVEPTPSELACPDDAFLNRDMSDRYMRLCLPPGATADHPFLNPFGPGALVLDGVAMMPTLVVVAGDDILRDRNVEFVRRMVEMGKPVEFVEFPGQGHAFFSLCVWSESVDELIRVFKQFMDKACQLQG